MQVSLACFHLLLINTNQNYKQRTVLLISTRTQETTTFNSEHRELKSISVAKSRQQFSLPVPYSFSTILFHSVVYCFICVTRLRDSINNKK